MKKLLAGVLTITILVMAACNNNKQKNEHDHNMNHDSMNHDKMQMDTMKDMKHDSTGSMNHNKQTGAMTEMNHDMESSAAANAAGTDPVVRKFINNIISEYLFIKNGLAADDKTGPKTGAAQMASSLKKFDKSFFKASQKKEFDKYADNMKEQLQGIITAKQIEEQRVLFGLLSQQVYGLVKSFGANQTLYYDHCPMANNNNGANWLSETKEIKNPYLGSSMPTCGTVQETLQK